jgi:hypothetical protein
MTRYRSGGAWLAGALGFAAAACWQEPQIPADTPAGLLTVFGTSVDGRHVARPEGVFVLTPNPPTADSRWAPDSCVAGEYRPQVFGSVSDLAAGDSILVTLGDATAVLRPVNRFGFQQYVLAHDTVSYTPGTAVRFVIPGASGGFPPATISSVMPLAVTSISPIPARPATTEPLVVTWDPAGDGSTTFELLLLYTLEGATDFNQQVVCWWRDDGQASIPGELLQGWALSEFQRRIEVTRFRTERQVIGENVLFLLATFDTIPPVTP